MRNLCMLALLAGSLALRSQGAQALPPATWHNRTTQGNTLPVKLAVYDTNARMNISRLDVNMAAVVYKKVNASRVSISTGHLAGGIYMPTLTNGKKLQQENSYTISPFYSYNATGRWSGSFFSHSTRFYAKVLRIGTPGQPGISRYPGKGTNDSCYLAGALV